MVEATTQPPLLNSRFQLVKRMVRKHNNSIWRGLDLQTQQSVAVKQISPVSYNAFVEEKILRTMKKTIGFPKFYGSANVEDSCYLIMQLLHKDLEQVFHSHKRCFTVELVMKLGMNMIDRLKKLHENGYVHRDIKPAQFMLDSQSDLLYLIDFNLSSKVPSAMSVSHDSYASYVGNATFSSVNAHTTKHQSRRDDLEAVMHVLIYFLKGCLPWQNLPYENDSEMWAKIKVCKSSISIDELCRDLPRELILCLTYCRSLKFSDLPDYEYLHGLMATAHSLQRSYSEIRKANTELNIKVSGSLLTGMKAFLSETIGAVPAVVPERRPKKKRYPCMIDRSILRKVDDFMRESHDEA